MNNTESQIKVLENILALGKTKNPFALKNKIKKLRSSLQQVKQNKAWEDYLSK